jgi:hypothetical protein
LAVDPTIPCLTNSDRTGVEEGAGNMEEVEFLFTLPPDPARSGGRTSIPSTNVFSVADTDDEVIEVYQGSDLPTETTTWKAQATSTTVSSPTQPQRTFSTAFSSDVGVCTKEEPRDASSAPKEGPSRRRFSLVDSAYVQSLAEVSYLLLHDTHWRYPMARAEAPHHRSNRPLFQWEHGDDLAVMMWLARRYRSPISELSQAAVAKAASSCKCLLCRDQKNTPVLTGSVVSSNAATMEGTESSVEEKSISHLEEARPTLISDLEAQREPHDKSDRSLYLFARLFYRKGPWFRLDDAYWRYYTQCFRNSTVAEKENNRSTQPDESRLDQLCVALESLMEDIESLRRKGILRGFLDEAECGRACDTSLFTKDERSLILSKLGVRKPTGKPNEVWSQMRTQRTIFGSSNGAILLPVRKHVAEILKMRLLQAMVQACAPSYIPAPEMKQWVARLELRVPESALFGCFRLREAPTLTLQRAIRLFTCATAGPGEMRGTVNGWASLLRHAQSEAPPPLSHVLPPPGINQFFLVSHPGLHSRFGLRSTYFRNSYQLITDCNSSLVERVFDSKESFEAWEMAVEIRSHVDYLVALTETLRSNERRKNRGQTPLGERSDAGPQSPLGSVDFLRFLSSKRDKIVEKLLPHSSRDDLDDVLTLIESDLANCFDEIEGEGVIESEKVLIAVAVTGLHVLSFRCRTLGPNEGNNLSRTWIRHLTWESVFAYVLWDVVPALERRELYRTATLLLETLLFGEPLKREMTPDGLKVPMFSSSITPLPLASVLLSRRARGKAYDRLVIDHNHLLSLDVKKSSAVREAFKTRRDDVLRFCEVALVSSLGSSQISFSSIRSLARRLKRPLSHTIGTRYCLEATELGLRYGNESDDISGEIENAAKRYSDWTPRIDTAVANALNSRGAIGEGSLGGRCTFVGFEDNGVDARSLTVEQLAMEYYRSGRFDLHALMGTSVVGGWLGWHDEGSNVRALFRILCAPVLGMDGYCQASSAYRPALCHLTPYQQAPFDLHVGFTVQQLNKCDASAGPTDTGTGFFCHRRNVIDKFLDKLSRLTPQDVSDLVYESVVARQTLSSHCKDPRLERDCARTRTLSLVAAGCGGPLLSAMFRCLLFDYRHYSGGLPDLLLVRATAAVSTSESTTTSLLIDLENWIGEGTFSSSTDVIKSFEDDEFLGCTKTSDTGSLSRTTSRGKRPSRSFEGNGDGKDGRTSTPSKADCSSSLPNRLQLVYEDRPVRVECAMVEVKSSNDRLDPRQEDWLNVIDRHGLARVCKFTSNAGPAGAPAS